jgi:hypothetical protein
MRVVKNESRVIEDVVGQPSPQRAERMASALPRRGCRRAARTSQRTTRGMVCVRSLTRICCSSTGGAARPAGTIDEVSTAGRGWHVRKIPGDVVRILCMAGRGSSGATIGTQLRLRAAIVLPAHEEARFVLCFVLLTRSDNSPASCEDVKRGCRIEVAPQDQRRVQRTGARRCEDVWHFSRRWPCARQW